MFGDEFRSCVRLPGLFCSMFGGFWGYVGRCVASVARFVEDEQLLEANEVMKTNSNLQHIKL